MFHPLRTQTHRFVQTTIDQQFQKEGTMNLFDQNISGLDSRITRAVIAARPSDWGMINVALFEPRRDAFEFSMGGLRSRLPERAPEREAVVLQHEIDRRVAEQIVPIKGWELAA